MLLLDYQVFMEGPVAAPSGCLSGTLRTKGDQTFSLPEHGRYCFYFLSGNRDRIESSSALHTPLSVINPVTSSAGVTSKA